MTVAMFLLVALYSTPLILMLYLNHCFATGHRAVGKVTGLMLEQTPNGVDKMTVQYQFSIWNRIFHGHELVQRETYDRLHVGGRVMIEYFGNRRIWSRILSPDENALLLRRASAHSLFMAVFFLFYGQLIVRSVGMNRRYHAIRSSGLATIGRVTAVHILKKNSRVRLSLDLEFKDNHDRKVLGHTGYFFPTKGTIWTQGDNIRVQYDRLDPTRFAVNLEEAKA